MPELDDLRPPYTVTELTEEMRQLLEEQYEWVQVRGEISNYKKAPSGHAYFRLKDDGAVMECVAWKTTVLRWSGLKLEDGVEVIAGGRISLYAPRGQYQLVVSAIRLAGIGALQQRFDRLKEKLAAEGLFDPDRKRPLPKVLKRVAVITSPTGAAVQDFLRVLKNNCCPVQVTVCPVLVQGGEAPGEISAMLQRVNRIGGFDLIVLCRGGGSLEDLWAFNEETVARAIFVSKIPVITGVGHEIDFTIADFVSDFRAPTPTGAAQAICDRFGYHRHELKMSIDRFMRGLYPWIQRRRERIEVCSRALRRYHPVTAIAHYRQRLDEIHLRLLRNAQARVAQGRPQVREKQRHLIRAAQYEFKRLRQDLNRCNGLLQCYNPSQNLARGFAICRREDGRVVVHAREIQPGETIQVSLSDGSLESKVIKVTLHP